MPDGQAGLLRLLTWLSPAFPVGAFSYSHGLETAVHLDLVTNAASLRDWLCDLVERGSAWNDAVLFAEAHRRIRGTAEVASAHASQAPPLPCRASPPQGGRLAVSAMARMTGDVSALPSQAQPISPLEGGPKDGRDAWLAPAAGRPEGGPLATSADDHSLADLRDLAEALAGSLERHRETMLQGSAFLTAARAWPRPALAALPEDCAYPVAVGAVAGAHGVELRAALAAFLHGFVSNQIQAAIRLGVIGQTDAMATLASLEAVIVETAAHAAQSSLDDLGSATMMAEIAAMQHETQYSRLFRT